jgi:hypothetical protein
MKLGLSDISPVLRPVEIFIWMDDITGIKIALSGVFVTINYILQ